MKFIESKRIQWFGHLMRINLTFPAANVYKNENGNSQINLQRNTKEKDGLNE